jgi:hypothetical protein
MEGMLLDENLGQPQEVARVDLDETLLRMAKYTHRGSAPKSTGHVRQATKRFVDDLSKKFFGTQTEWVRCPHATHDSIRQVVISAHSSDDFATPQQRWSLMSWTSV